MNFRKKAGLWLAGGFLAFSLITGCSQKKEETKGDITQEEASQGDISLEENQKKSQTPAADESILMSVGMETVSKEEAEAYLFFLKHQYEGEMGTSIWKYKVEGQTLEAYAREQIQSLLTQVKITKQVADKEGISLTEDELDEARNSAQDYLELISEEEKEEVQSYLSEELLTQIFAENILANKVFEITTNDVDTNISDEEARQVTIQYLMVMTHGTDRNGVKVDMTDEEKKEARNKTNKLLKEAKETSNFFTFAESNTDAQEVQISFSMADAPESLKKISFQLQSGQTSAVVAGQNGYYIVYCVNDNDEDATAEKKEELIQERQRDSFEQKFTKWSADYEIVVSTTLWNKLKF